MNDPADRVEKIQELKEFRDIWAQDIAKNTAELVKLTDLRLAGVKSEALDKMIESKSEAHKQYVIAHGHIDQLINQLENWAV